MRVIRRENGTVRVDVAAENLPSGHLARAVESWRVREGGDTLIWCRQSQAFDCDITVTESGSDGFFCAMHETIEKRGGVDVRNENGAT